MGLCRLDCYFLTATHCTIPNASLDRPTNVPACHVSAIVFNLGCLTSIISFPLCPAFLYLCKVAKCSAIMIILICHDTGSLESHGSIQNDLSQPSTDVIAES